MRSHTELNILPPQTTLLLWKAQELVGMLPDWPTIRCHELARAVVRFFLPITEDRGWDLELRVVDGMYGHVDHSWIQLVVKEQRFILDVYAVGREPQVCLLLDSFVVRDSESYRTGDPRWNRTDIDEGLIQDMLRVFSRASRSFS